MVNMKRLALVALLALEMMVGGCGGSGTTNTATTTASGTWQAVLTGGVGEAATLSFVTEFTVNGDGSLNISNIEFITGGSTSCFQSGATASGSLNVTTTNNIVTGPLSFTVQSGVPAGNTLTLTGTETGPTITGTWNLTGSATCSDSSTTGPTRSFTMCQGSGACTPSTT